jgi:hypothetical protein
MKHWILGALLLSTVVLTACGTDTTTSLSFQEAKKLSMNDSTIVSQLLLGSDVPYQQDFSLKTNLQWEGIHMVLNLLNQSQQDKKAEKSQGTFTFDTQIVAEEEHIEASGSIATFITPQDFSLNIQAFHLTGNDPMIAMVSMVAQGIQGQWLTLPISGGQTLLEGANDYLSTLTTLQTQSEDILIQQGNAPYQGNFSQFANQPAYQFTLDQEKLQLLLQEVMKAINTFNQHSLALDTMMEDESEVLAELTGIDVKIPLFEGNLVLLGNNKVAIVVDTFEISVNEMVFVGEYRYGPEGLLLQMREKETAQDILKMHFSQTKGNTYAVDVQLAGIPILQGTITTIKEKAELGLEFDLTLELGNLLFGELS